MKISLPVLTVVLAVVAVWYGAAALMNRAWEVDQAVRSGAPAPAFSEMLVKTMSQERPVLPAPHQVVNEVLHGILAESPTSKRSLLYHGWTTLSAALLGFAIGMTLGAALAIGVVHNNTMNMSVMPWAIASQSIPILAIAPMLIVVLNSIGVQGILPKAIIAAYLSFFPVVVGMVKGLQTPDKMQLDLLRTYDASARTVLIKLRLPASIPYLFASAKVATAASLVGAIVGELPSGAKAGLGTRLLGGSYYGQTILVWSALFAAAILAAGLVALIAKIERLTLNRMGLVA